MKKARKTLSLALALLLIVTLLAACGESPAPAPNAEATPTPAPETPAEPAPEAPAEPAPAEDITLTYWSMYNDTEPQHAVFQSTVDRFMADNPNITVEITWVGRDIRNTIKAALDSGQSIDVIQYDPQYLTVNCQENLLRLDDYMDKAYPITGAQTIRERCLPVLLKWLQDSASDGGLYGMPSEAVVVTFLYNKTLFTQAGITAPPQTWPEFLDACDKLAAAGINAFVLDDAYMSLLPGYYLARSKGEDWVKQLMTDKTGEMWKDPAVLQMAEAFTEMRERGHFSPTMGGSAWPAGQQEVGLGETAMYLTGNWLPNELKDLTGPDFDWGMFSFPSLPGGTDDNTVAVVGAQGFAINKNTENPDAAFALLTYFNADQTEQDLVEQCIDIPVTPDVAWPPKLTDIKAIYSGLTDYYVWGCGAEEDPDLLPILISNFTKVLGGSLTPEQFVEEMAAAGNRA